MTAPVRIGTDPSSLARARVARVAGRLGEHEVVEISVSGDAETVVNGLRAALLRDDVDVLVHDYAALPMTPPAGIDLAAVVKRADVMDAFCAEGGVRLDALAPAARVGADTPRRRAQLLAARPDIEITMVSGDIEAALASITASEEALRLDGLMVAAADLQLLGRSDAAHQLLELIDWPTEPAQGALAIEIRSNATGDVRRRVIALDHRPTRLVTSAERGVVAQLEAAGIALPIAANALIEDGLLFLTASVYAPDGSDSVTASHAAYPEDVAEPAAELAARVAAELLERGARDLAPGPQ